MTRGGKREGAGRPTGEPTKMMRIPLGAVEDISHFIKQRKQLMINRAAFDSILSQADCLKLEVSSSDKIPLVSSRIAAGFPSPADDYIEQYLDLNQLLIGNKSATFMVRVKKESESMIDAGIYPDDILIVDRSLTPSHKDIVIAVLDGDLTVKELSIQGRKVSLVPRNKKMKPIVIKEGQELLVWGVVTSVIHQFKR